MASSLAWRAFTTNWHHKYIPAVYAFIGAFIGWKWDQYNLAQANKFYGKSALFGNQKCLQGEYAPKEEN